jgi:hypothetical protein
MVRGRSSSGSNSSGGGPGLFGGLGLGVVSQCDSEDDSAFCQFSRFMQVITMIFTLFFFIYLVYMFVKPYLGKRKRR